MAQRCHLRFCAAYILPWSSRDQTKISTRNAKTIEYRSTEPRQNKCPPKFCSWHVLHLGVWSMFPWQATMVSQTPRKCKKKQCHLWFFSNMFQHITYESWNYQSDLNHNFGPRTEGLFSTVAQIGQQLEPESHRVSMDWFNIDGSVCVFHGANPRMIVIQCIVYI